MSQYEQLSRDIHRASAARAVSERGYFETTHYVEESRTYIVRTDADGSHHTVKDSATAVAHVNKILEKYGCDIYLCAHPGGAVAICGGPVCSGFAPSCRSPRADELAFKAAIREKMPKAPGVLARMRTVMALVRHVSSLAAAEVTSDRQLLAAGICSCCGEQPLAHGPWSAEQIETACAADGYEVEHFEDWCNSCLLEHVFMGDREFAAKHGCVVAEGGAA